MTHGSKSERLAHFNDAQREFIKLRAARDLRLGNPAVLSFINGVSLIDVLKSFATDRRPDPEGTFELDMLDALHCETASSLAGRLKLAFDPPLLTLDEITAMDLAALSARSALS